MSNEGLIKLHVSLPNHWMVSGESMWAEPVGDDIYRLENVPFFCYGINFQDELKALPDDDDILEVSEVVKRSGNKTIRICFDKTIASKDSQEPYLNVLRNLDCSLERWDETYLAINIRKTADYNQVYEQLDEWCDKEILAFETCHERVKGSFDDLLEESE